MAEGHIGGHTRRVYGKFDALPDSVELACQFVREVEDPAGSVPAGGDLVYRGFAVEEYWDQRGGDDNDQ